ncbi:CYTH-like domain-containing protein [Pilobolus umbonatus]|nr:CYTH-like domain-containing protein [Pilobolus umbonatus]
MSMMKRTADELDSNEPPVKRVQQVIHREPSIFNIRPLDDITKYIMDFISEHCGRENVEIEAKIGVLIDKQTNKRLKMGVATETVVPQTTMRNCRFESNMTLEQHRFFNNLLNDLVNKTQARDYKGERIKYKHTNEKDRFYEGQNRGKVRVTVDQATGQIVPNGIIEKIRVSDINIHCPNQTFDYRISISIELPRPKPTSLPSFERNKDRISYQHGGFSFDLTQVKGAADSNTETRHELELEFVDAGVLLKEKNRYDTKQPSQYTHMIESFVNNIRLLSSRRI